jgi:hypothetical protein
MNENVKRTWKQKLSDNAGDIAFWGTTVAVIGGYIGLVAFAVKKQGDLIETEMQQNHELAMQAEVTRSEALARGAQVLPKGDGTYWIIENDGRVA